MRAFDSVSELKNFVSQISVGRGMARAIRSGRVHAALIATLLLVGVFSLGVGSMSSALRADDEPTLGEGAGPEHGPNIIEFDVDVLVVDLDASIYRYTFKGMVENCEELDNPQVRIAGGDFDELLNIDGAGIFEKTVVINGYGGLSVFVEAVIMEGDEERSPAVTIRTP